MQLCHFRNRRVERDRVREKSRSDVAAGHEPSFSTAQQTIVYARSCRSWLEVPDLSVWPDSKGSSLGPSYKQIDQSGVRGTTVVCRRCQPEISGQARQVHLCRAARSRCIASTPARVFAVVSTRPFDLPAARSLRGAGPLARGLLARDACMGTGREYGPTYTASTWHMKHE